jgi:hypothetical protein
MWTERAPGQRQGQHRRPTAPERSEAHALAEPVNERVSRPLLPSKMSWMETRLCSASGSAAKSVGHAPSVYLRSCRAADGRLLRSASTVPLSWDHKHSTDHDDDVKVGAVVVEVEDDGPVQAKDIARAAVPPLGVARVAGGAVAVSSHLWLEDRLELAERIEPCSLRSRRRDRALGEAREGGFSLHAQRGSGPGRDGPPTRADAPCTTGEAARHTKARARPPALSAR